jgi:GDP-4-dehydro-6-deoxy-D-mannose reductase
VERYASRDWHVVGTYRRSSADHSWLPGGVDLRRIDLNDKAAVLELLADVRPDVVVHLAAQSSVSASWNDPMGTMDANTRMQYNVLEGVVAITPETRVLVVGSSDEYGCVGVAENPVGEHQPLLPTSPYGLSKVVQDLMAAQYASTYRLCVMRVRPFHQIGPRRAPRFVAGSFARQIAEIEAGMREAVLTVGNLELVRDFTDVRDAIEAYVMVVENGDAGVVYNVATGTGRTIAELLEAMLEAAGIQAEVRPDPGLARTGEAAVITGDAGKLRRELGWHPAISFEQSAADTVNYWREYVRQSTADGSHLN